MAIVESHKAVIRTPDYRLRVFVSSTLKELAEERKAVREAILRFHMAPVMFEAGARPHPAQKLYRAYLKQSHIFIGIYWQSYGWVGPGMTVSGLEDEYELSKDLPSLIYVKGPAADREPGLKILLEKIRERNASAYKSFSTCEELRGLVESDLALLLTEHFEAAGGVPIATTGSGTLPPGNIPVPRTPLIGRQHELECGKRLILGEDAALVTLTGPGGTGKSRLGIELALELRDHFKDGAFLIPLESIRNPELVIPAIASSLGLSESPGNPPLAELLYDFLGDREMLLLLDNFEQVLPAGPQISRMLEACPRLKILITSRAPLHLRAERELHVPPLAVPPRAAEHDPGSLSSYSSTQLFLQRAQSIRPDFQINRENAPAVTEILQQVDGLPLAIELASARIRLLSPEALLPRLEHRFDVLRGGTRDLPARQRTLYGAIEWSYGLLSEDDQRLFRRLSVFNDGWDIEAAEAVCGGEGEQGVFEGLESLLDNNLIVSPEDADGDLRLRMLGTIREFALERLKECGEAEAILARHARFFLRLVQQADAELSGPAQQSWFQRLKIEGNNVRAARSWALERHDVEFLLRLCVALARFADVRGYYREGRAWVEGALAMSAEGGSQGQVPPDLRARSLRAAGLMAYAQRDLPAAQRYFRESLALFQELGESSDTASLLADLGKVAMTRGDRDHARDLYNKVLALRREQNDIQGIASVLTSLGLLAMRARDLAKAEEQLEESARLYRGLGDKAALSNTLFDLGLVEVRRPDSCDRAAASFSESVALSRELGYHRVTAYALNNLAMLALDRGESVQATLQAQESLELCRAQEDTLGAFYALIVVGHGLFDQGQPARASRRYAEALLLLQEIESTSSMPWREELVWLLHGGVHMAIALDQPQQAVRLGGAAETLCKQEHLSLPPCATGYYESILAKGREQLPAAEYETVWEAGQALSEDQARQELAQVVKS
jgi:predicted ATPase